MSDPQQHYQWAGSVPGVGVVQLNSREVEEGEISDRIPSSDDDASPRSLVIDAQDQGGGHGKGRGMLSLESRCQ